ncbi:MAG TPA: carboxylating nicotinate-nucleotide diphosphorylase [Actinomycetota bacterium]|nr:carboxylating nicotinate-nucleotide diphosphorylase [Actinomycetota bacterium]
MSTGQGRDGPRPAASVAGHGTPPAGADPDRELAELFRPVVRAALDEDLGRGGDPTSQELAGEAAARLVARSGGVVAGLAGVEVALVETASRLGLPPGRFLAAATDGDRVAPAAVLGRVAGPARVLLAAERTILNLLGHLSGVATLTAAFVARVEGTAAVVRDTRKTTPGLRLLEKYAVRCGGGRNHRLGLYDALLVKDNHLRAAGGLAAAVAAARAAAPDLPLEVEADTLEQVAEALEAGCDLVLLDNMDAAKMARAVVMAQGKARTEASGGITLATVREVARTGVDFVAVGALTHSAPALDVALDWE